MIILYDLILILRYDPNSTRDLMRGNFLHDLQFDTNSIQNYRVKVEGFDTFN
jgi:hypothetical protein